MIGASYENETALDCEANLQNGTSSKLLCNGATFVACLKTRRAALKGGSGLSRYDGRLKLCTITRCHLAEPAS